MGTAVAEMLRRESTSGVQEEKCIVMMGWRTKRNRAGEIKVWVARYAADVNGLFRCALIPTLIPLLFEV
jgi:hypothetical protein